MVFSVEVEELTDGRTLYLYSFAEDAQEPEDTDPPKVS